MLYSSVVLSVKCWRTKQNHGARWHAGQHNVVFVEADRLFVFSGHLQSDEAERLAVAISNRTKSQLQQLDCDRAIDVDYRLEYCTGESGWVWSIRVLVHGHTFENHVEKLLDFIEIYVYYLYFKLYYEWYKYLKTWQYYFWLASMIHCRLATILQSTATDSAVAVGHVSCATYR